MMKSLKNKLRLDEYLVENEYYESLDLAKRNIMAGNVLINEIKKEKPGEIIEINKIKSIRVKQRDCPYVSRGGLKLEKAIKEFKIDFKDKMVLDIGASTGGFTDCALQNGAKFVYAIDVGTNQLDWKLRNNIQIKSIENKHINDLEFMDIDNVRPDILVMDISFISIKKVILNLKKFMRNDSVGIFLIKPQFEVSREFLEKGIVKDINEQKNIIEEIVNDFETKGVYLKNITVSPIRGSKGNIEYLAEFSVNIEYKVKSIKELLENLIIDENEHNKHNN
ncbi:MAG: TlyA family RNA methyltransferase [Fusobacterium gastrosuis]|uniref:TlyA family RNA methyltransferase n=1 Tax=Fusobacterium TaxID=848 RepID=UPI0025C677B8|nr:TlyA family RNA methyltransferase [Fusobacterium sp.]MCI7224003.1 TlyA family RNA methyltransferase [Fusobacterium sp.]MDD7391787.1 TlyA family RNA methyltransferase [Fusobacteriaceae bacterium]MDY5795122.1 TlyA family RNA methyltransferase [Fusobacterium gastrosuis]